MKYYTFLDEAGTIIEQVRAESHAEAVASVSPTNQDEIDTNTDFYSETLED